MSEQVDQRPVPSVKLTFEQALKAGRQTLWDFINSLNEHQLTAFRDAGGWTIKDHLVNLAMYEKGMSALLQHQSRWVAVGLDEQFVFACESFEPINDALRAQYQNQDADAILVMLKQVQDAFDQVIANLTDADLMQSYSYYQPYETRQDSGEPILNWLAGNTYDHYAEHLPWMQAIRDNALNEAPNHESK